MMRIAFDFQVFLFQEYGGISRYYGRLASALNSLDGVEARIFAPLHLNAYLAELPAGMVKGRDVRHWRKSKKLFRAINAMSSRLLMRAYKPNVVHETYYSSTSLAFKGVPVVVTVHDMIHERFPEMFPAKDQTSKLKRAAVEKADQVICVSENTRKDLLEYFGTAEKKVSVVHHGFQEFSHGVGASDRLMSIGEKPYFLYVGQRSGYKNFDRFIRAFASSQKLRNGYRVVCFGGGAFRQEEWRAFHELGLEEAQTVQVGGDDSAMAHCYQHAFALVYPSLYEGFGLPPLEAMSVGCPVIGSCTSSIPEILGPAAEYFDPASIESMREGLERVAISSDRRRELVRLGGERYKQFTWQRCAEETLAVYERLI
jgi:glycosyltransferase involved in cell wall biosynthesis